MSFCLYLPYDCLPTGVYMNVLNCHFLLSFSSVPIESFCEACKGSEKLSGPADVNVHSQIRLAHQGCSPHTLHSKSMDRDHLHSKHPLEGILWSNAMKGSSNTVEGFHFSPGEVGKALPETWAKNRVFLRRFCFCPVG